MSRGFLLSLGALALLLVILGGFYISHEHFRAIQSEQQAIEHKGKADLYAEQARSLEAAKGAAESRIANADAQVAKLRMALSSAPTVPVDPQPPVDPGPTGPIVDLAPRVEALESLVSAQDEAIKARDAKILILEAEAGSWHKAHDERAAECVQLQAALAAQKGLASGNLWKGRIQGFAVGVASGYVVGRLH